MKEGLLAGPGRASIGPTSKPSQADRLCRELDSFSWDAGSGQINQYGYRSKQQEPHRRPQAKAIRNCTCTYTYGQIEIASKCGVRLYVMSATTYHATGTLLAVKLTQDM